MGTLSSGRHPLRARVHRWRACGYIYHPVLATPAPPGAFTPSLDRISLRLLPAEHVVDRIGLFESALLCVEY
jgi:hypothetical protein